MENNTAAVNTNAERAETTSDSESQNRQTKRFKDLQYTITVRPSATSIDVSYEIKNTGKTAYILYNRGDRLNKTVTGKIYTDLKDGGIIELSQKKFEEPKGKNCPDRFAPYEPGATWLKPGQIVKGGGRVALPLKADNPFHDCEPRAEFPAAIKQIQFCLGIAEADAGKTKVSDKGFIESREGVKAQELLCSEVINLN